MITVLIADDEHLVRSGLRNILATAADITIVAEAGDGREAVEQARRVLPDVVLTDIRMPGTDGLTALRELVALPAPPRVIMLTTFDLDEFVYQALQDGAAGFLLKDTPAPDLITAVRVVAAGDSMLAPSITRRLITHFAAQIPPETLAARRLLKTLTPRERQVLHLVGLGRGNYEIGRQLAMSEPTVKGHVSRILAKLNLGNRVQAAILAVQAGERLS